MSYTNVRGRQLPFVVGYFADLAIYRHLCWNLVGSDLRARFRRSAVGVLWAMIQPMAFAMMVAAVWGSMFNVANYWEFALYMLSGLIVWEYFGTIINISQDALSNAEGYLKQTKIPFIVFQVRVPLTAMVIALFGTIGFFVLQILLGQAPPAGLHLLLLPLFFALLLMFAIPVSIIMSFSGLLFRDLKYISQIAVQALFFVSPVMLDRALLNRPELSLLKYLNPVVPLLDLFRNPALYGRLWESASVLTLLVWIVALWVVALAGSANLGRRLIFAL